MQHVWVVNHSDLDGLEDQIRLKFHCDTYDLSVLRTAVYGQFRRRCIECMAGNVVIQPYETLELGPVTVWVKAAHPEGVLELELVDSWTLYQPDLSEICY